MDKKLLIRMIVFNIAETILIVVAGNLIGLSAISICTLMLTFMITRGYLGKALHFKDWKRCLLWSLLILISLFISARVSLHVGTLFTIFGAFIMTGRANVCDIYMWGTKVSKHIDIEEYVTFNKQTDEYERIMKAISDNNKRDILLFEARFIERLTYEEISERFNIPTQRITVLLDDIANTIRVARKL